MMTSGNAYILACSVNNTSMTYFRGTDSNNVDKYNTTTITGYPTTPKTFAGGIWFGGPSLSNGNDRKGFLYHEIRIYNTYKRGGMTQCVPVGKTWSELKTEYADLKTKWGALY